MIRLNYFCLFLLLAVYVSSTDQLGQPGDYNYDDDTDSSSSSSSTTHSTTHQRLPKTHPTKNDIRLLVANGVTLMGLKEHYSTLASSSKPAKRSTIKPAFNVDVDALEIVPNKDPETAKLSPLRSNPRFAKPNPSSPSATPPLRCVNVTLICHRQTTNFVHPNGTSITADTQILCNSSKTPRQKNSSESGSVVVSVGPSFEVVSCQAITSSEADSGHASQSNTDQMLLLPWWAILLICIGGLAFIGVIGGTFAVLIHEKHAWKNRRVQPKQPVLKTVAPAPVAKPSSASRPRTAAKVGMQLKPISSSSKNIENFTSLTANSDETQSGVSSAISSYSHSLLTNWTTPSVTSHPLTPGVAALPPLRPIRGRNY